MSPRTYYDTLQVSRYASPSVIRAAYRALSQKHHPDKNLGNEQLAHANMQKLNEAFSVLSDDERRASYDKLIESIEAEIRARSKREFVNSHQPPPEPTRPQARAASAPSSATTKRHANSKVKEAKHVQWLLSVLRMLKNIFGILIKSALVVFGIFVVVSSVNWYLDWDKRTSALSAATTKEAPWEKAAKVQAIEAEKMRNSQLALAQPSRPQAPVLTPRKNNALPLSDTNQRVSPLPVEVRKKDYSCLSNVTLNLNSSNYSGTILVELRSGYRPGSAVIERFEIYSSGTIRATNVCPGTYFYAFATPDSLDVSTTRYFEVEQSAEQYSMPEITVTYTKYSSPGGQKVGTASRNSL